MGGKVNMASINQGRGSTVGDAEGEQGEEEDSDGRHDSLCPRTFKREEMNILITSILKH